MLLSLALDWKKLRCVLEGRLKRPDGGLGSGGKGVENRPPFHKRLDKLKVSAWGHDDDQNRDHCLVRLLARH
jgi:hypothetical protein